MLTLAQIQAEAYSTACSKGWHDKPLRSMVVGYTIGSPAPGSPVFVVVEGEHAGSFCSPSESIFSATTPCPSRMFGQPLGDDAQEIWSINHDAVLRAQSLMHTELTEAHDAIDEGFDELYFDDNGKPEGLPAEIADLAIRICDVTRALGLSIPAVHESQSSEHWLTRAKGMRPAWEIQRQPDEHSRNQCAVLWLGNVRRYVDQATEAARIDDWALYADRLATAVFYAASIVSGYGHDLNAAIEAKMGYNKTRSHRHGGKQA